MEEQSPQTHSVINFFDHGAPKSLVVVGLRFSAHSYYMDEGFWTNQQTAPHNITESPDYLLIVRVKHFSFFLVTYLYVMHVEFT